MGLSYTFIFHTNHGSFHTIGSNVSYCMRYPIIQWHCMFILSAGIVHTNTPDDFIPARVMFHTSYVCATTQPPTPYSLYSAPDARDVLCTTRSPFACDPRVMFVHKQHPRSCTPSTPPICPNHLPSWKEKKQHPLRLTHLNHLPSWKMKTHTPSTPPICPPTSVFLNTTPPPHLWFPTHLPGIRIRRWRNLRSLHPPYDSHSAPDALPPSK